MRPTHNRDNTMAAVFECRLKQERAGMPKGTTIQVPTNLASPDASQIADVCERLFGKKARDASFPGYWDIRRL